MNKVKIAHVITRMIIGGAQENTLFTVEGLAENEQFEVTLIVGSQTGPEGNLLADVDIQTAKYQVRVITQLVRQVNPFLDLFCLYRLICLFKKEKYDVVHTHSSKAGILGRIAAFFSGTKVVVHTIHGLPFHPYQSKLLNFIYIVLEKAAAVWTDKIITVCSVMMNKALSVNIAGKEKFQTVYSGTDLDLFLKAKQSVSSLALRQQYGLASDDIVIGKIARLFHLKGHQYVIAVAESIIKKIPKVKFFFVGDGIFKEKFQRQIKELGLENYFVFTGLIPPKDIPGILSLFDLLVHCSLREGLARVLPYALAEGIPVVSFDIDGASEVVHDFQTGFLVPPKDTLLLEEKIIKILSDKKLYKAMAVAGPLLVDPLFRKEYMVSEIKKLYASLLEKPKIKD